MTAGRMGARRRWGLALLILAALVLPLLLGSP